MNDREYAATCLACIKKIKEKGFPLTEEEDKDYNFLRYAYQCYKGHDREFIQDYKEASELFSQLNLKNINFHGFHPQIKIDETTRIDLTDIFERWLDK